MTATTITLFLLLIVVLLTIIAANTTPKPFPSKGPQGILIGLGVILAIIIAIRMFLGAA